ncbi:Na+/H+ antiporter [Aliirhizobium cellulosilyticum]|uniref:CPA1 family monovalent cation:H+ antiporter n=1 Tax=Aliirhizobium cellulosilyticum TaxID=393664 RepID=A0A7W6TFN3_9HYPH|nr:Na+/H+ antiporter [Rhizobium cellulosilyticum]MBB4349361.1 CPA1 family monovalent cation:H+ antiporter [Rhizobium cellulosilyticum]MBB4412417.1 CPA1 family monovalent cation:H+ antiporter [Rhizobium cellulosilyticum]MBB4447049.1 CPA1 family monovalent cation:H+ antiporter [Rhizobium cellulosilyticum]
MSIEREYEFLIGLLMAVIVLALAARKLRLPPATALISGGVALAFIPGIPAIAVDPNLIMVAFLPPLLLSSAYQTVWLDFKQYFASITSLAIGAVAFTTLTVGCVVHWLRPDLPWSATFALGAIVSPPDAVAAKALLERVRLPNKVTAVLTGESLVNDASGLVLFHFALAATMSGSFNAPTAFGEFLLVSLGGIAVGMVLGWLALRLLQQFGTSELVVTGTLLLAAISYMISDGLGFSGVLATVTTGLMLGWQQHEIFSAVVRIRTQAFWRILVFLLQSLLFILIGLSLREALHRFESVGEGVRVLAVPVICVVVTVIVARFTWMIGSDLLWAALLRLGFKLKHRPSIPVTIIVSWAGMRGVVTLAAALSLPMTFPGRDLILASAFGVILVTVLIQGSTLPLLIRLIPSLKPQSASRIAMEEEKVRLRVARVQAQFFASHLASTEKIADNGSNPLAGAKSDDPGEMWPDAEEKRTLTIEHFHAVLAAVRAARAEVLSMYRAGQVSDKVMKDIEEDLDLQEIAAEKRVSDDLA